MATQRQQPGSGDMDVSPDAPILDTGAGLSRRGFVARAFRLSGLAIAAAAGALTVAALRGAQAAKRVLRMTSDEFGSGSDGPRVVQGEVVVGTAGPQAALLARCTHLGCRLAVSGQGDRLECACHGSRFAPDGAVLRGPARHPLRRLEVQRVGDEVHISLPTDGTWSDAAVASCLPRDARGRDVG